MAEKLTKKQLKAIKKHRKDNPKETSHARRARLLKNKPWWMPRD